MAGRPRKFNRDVAVDRFRDLFWQKGYVDTSVDDLQAAAGIQRGSFYAAFGDKESAWLEALQLYTNEFAHRADAALHAKPTATASLANFLRFAGNFLAGHSGKGCFLLSSIAQPPHLNQSKYEAFADLTQALRRPICEVCDAAAKEDSNQNADTLSSWVLSQILGLNALTRSGAPAKDVIAAAEFAALRFG
jgi:TetR/AcrR family transcriptional repressor of nem operon